MTTEQLAKMAATAKEKGFTSVVLHVKRERAPKDDCALVPGLRARCIGYRPANRQATLAVNADALAAWCDSHPNAPGIWTMSVG